MIFEVYKRYIERHRHDLTYGQRQDLAAWLGLKWVAPRYLKEPRPALTPEEIAYLVERLEGVNDPVGASALAKLRAML
jgi:hypothetical protein